MERLSRRVIFTGLFFVEEKNFFEKISPLEMLLFKGFRTLK
jgi:hypothetical protein